VFCRRSALHGCRRAHHLGLLMDSDDQTTRHGVAKTRPIPNLSVAPFVLGGQHCSGRGVADIISPVAFAFWRWTPALVYPSRCANSYGLTEIVRRWRVLFGLAVLGSPVSTPCSHRGSHHHRHQRRPIQTTMPAVIVLLSLALYREKVSRRQMAGVLLCLLGAGLIVLRRVVTLLTCPSSRRPAHVHRRCPYGLYSALLRRRPSIHPLSFLAATFSWARPAFFPSSGGTGVVALSP
jgi:hypothetical protein